MAYNPIDYNAPHTFVNFSNSTLVMEESTPTLNLEQHLQKGVVQFVFRKKTDGTLRRAIGTLHPTIIPIMTRDKATKLKESLTNAANGLYSANTSGAKDVVQRTITHDLLGCITTLTQCLTPPDAKPKADGAAIRYFDLTAQEWRSVASDAQCNILGFLEL